MMNAVAATCFAVVIGVIAGFVSMWDRRDPPDLGGGGRRVPRDPVVPPSLICGWYEPDRPATEEEVSMLNKRPKVPA